MTADEQTVFEMINDARATAGVGPLEWCDGLYACAKAHSNDMCVRGFFSHTNPEGEDPSDRGRLGHAGSYTFTPIVSYPYVRINENIAYGYSTPAEVMNAWMNSPGHRANILNSGSTHIGVGNCDQCGSHWTLNFGNRW
ncbi:MAG: CAP domain-containing protein [Planctomycetota bacterium]|nr:MAG: CAP domain-containing protein [Planctomycetota bacterium]